MGICERIALAVDFSDASKIAARAAVELAKKCGAKRLMMIHAMKPVVMPAESQPVVRQQVENLRRRMREGAEKHLDAMCEELAAPADLAIERRIVEGHPVDAIPKAAAELQATLLAIGSHSRRGIRRWVSGSVAEMMLSHVRTPTMVLLTGADGVPPDREIASLERVLIAIDEDPTADQVARAGFALVNALSPRPKVVIFHAVEPIGLETMAAGDPDVASYLAAREAEVRQAADRIAKRYGGGIDFEVMIVRGNADDAIVEAADRLPAQLIVMGTHGSGLPEFMTLGSTAAQVVRRSNVSVMVVPETLE